MCNKQRIYQERREDGEESHDVVATLQAHNNGGFPLNSTHPIRIGGQVRRLTPLECERLQGYPDGWADIGPWADSARKLHKESSDSARYKALGNSIALPPWSWVLNGFAPATSGRPRWQVCLTVSEDSS